MTDIKLTNAHIMFGDALERLKELPDNSVDSVVTDPPYGLSDNKYVAETIEKWILGERTFIPDGKGFMGKAWDSFVPPPAIWDECMRVLKPGGHLLAFFGSRTQDVGALSIRLAGFEIRDSIAWVYGSGFPKSLDISKAIDKQAGAEREVVGKGQSGKTAIWSEDGNMGDFDITAPATDVAKQWAGWGTALKPAVEPIVVARKPLSEKTVANNVLKWGTGGLNIDASRIGTETITQHKVDMTPYHGNKLGVTEEGTIKQTGVSTQTTGRFPANIILGHTEDCVEVGVKEEAVAKNVSFNDTKQADGWGVNHANTEPVQISTPVYECIDGCPVKELDRQTAGKLSPGHWAKTKVSGYGEFGNGESTYEGVGQKATDSAGGASRFFYVAKASKKDRNEGLEGLDTKGKIFNGQNPVSAGKAEGSVEDKFTTQPAQNFHPTVKPTTLMEYLIKLVTPEGGTVLDPFTGSGSTGKAALLNGFKFIGCELTEEYLPIIEGRLKFAENKYSEQQAKQAETLFDIEGEE